MSELPQAAAMKLMAFIKSGATGSVTFHVERGVVRAWEVKETGRIDTGAKTGA